MSRDRLLVRQRAICTIACGYMFITLKLKATRGIAVTRLDNQHHCNYGSKLITR
jgi:hypothetical protein